MLDFKDPTTLKLWEYFHETFLEEPWETATIHEIYRLKADKKKKYRIAALKCPDEFFRGMYWIIKLDSQGNIYKIAKGIIP